MSIGATPLRPEWMMSVALAARAAARELDGRGLTRIAAGKSTVFKRRDRHRGSTAIVCLLDVSASMKSHMPTVHRAAYVVAEALRGLSPRAWYEVLTYTSGGLHPGAPVQLTRLASPGMPLSLRDVWCDGGTPTGEAIAAAAPAEASGRATQGRGCTSPMGIRRTRMS